MSRESKTPQLMFIAGIVMMLCGGGLLLMGKLDSRDFSVLEAAKSASYGGNREATENFEKAVNRYEAPPVVLNLSGNNPEIESEHIRKNANAINYRDQAVLSDRISFRREWREGFGIKLLGVVDTHNFCKLNLLRARASSDPAEIKRLTGSLRTIGNWLLYDPMTASVWVYAPDAHIWLFGLNEALNRVEYSDEELERLLAELKEDESRYSDYFIRALRHERDLLDLVPESLKVYEKYPGDAVYEADRSQAYDNLTEFALLLKSDYYQNREALENFMVKEGDGWRITEELSPRKDYAELLAQLTTHNRLAQLALEGELFFRRNGRLPEKGELPELKNAFNGEPLVLESGKGEDGVDYIRSRATGVMPAGAPADFTLTLR